MKGMRSEIIEQTVKLGTVEPTEKWDLIKEVIQKYSTNFSKCKADTRRLVIGELAEKVKDYEDNLDSLNEEEIVLMQHTKIDLFEQQAELTHGVLFRTKAKWTMEGERNTKYFYSLEKSKGSSRTCVALHDEERKCISDDPNQILQLQRKFYQELYTADTTVNFDLVNETSQSILENSLAAMEEQLSLEELKTAAKGLNNNKSPGPDGIPIEFYKVFGMGISDVLYSAVTASYYNKHFIPSSSKGILNLIPKQDKDTKLLANLRPITLLNCDYKIVEKAIANRMVEVMDFIINCDQRGFLPDRKISSGIC